MDVDALNDEIDTLYALQAGLLSVMAALVATHPNYRHLQLHMVSMTEVAVEGSLGRLGLRTDRQRAVARQVAEILQQIREVPAGTIRPYQPPRT